MLSASPVGSGAAEYSSSPQQEALTSKAPEDRFFFPISVNAFLTVSPRFIAKEMSQQELDAQLSPTGADDDSTSKREGSIRTSNAAAVVQQVRHICELSDPASRVALISRYQSNIFKGDGSVAEGCCYLLSAPEQDLYTHKMKGHLQQQQLQQRDTQRGAAEESVNVSSGSALDHFLRSSEASIANSSAGQYVLPAGLKHPIDYCFTCPISSTAHKNCERFSVVAKESAPSPTVVRVGYLLAHLFCHHYFRAVSQQQYRSAAEEQQSVNLVADASVKGKDWLSEMEFFNMREDSRTMLRAQGAVVSSAPPELPAAARFGRHNFAAVVAAGILQAAKMYRQQPQVNLPYMIHVIHERALMYDSILPPEGGGTDSVEDSWMDQVISYEMAMFQLVSSTQPLRDLMPPEGYIRELLARMQPVLAAEGKQLPTVVKEVIGRVAMKILEVAYMDSDLIFTGCSTQTLVADTSEATGETMQGEQDHSVRFVRGPISRVMQTMQRRTQAADNGGRVKDPTTRDGESVLVPHGATYDAAVCSVLMAVCGLISTAGSHESGSSSTGLPFPAMVWGVPGCSGSQLDEPCIKDAPSKWEDTLSFFRELATTATVPTIHDVLLKAAISPPAGSGSVSLDSELFDIAKAGTQAFYSRFREVSRVNVLQERLRFLHSASPISRPQVDSEPDAALNTAFSVHAAHFTRDLIEGSKLTDLPFSDPIIQDPKPTGCTHQEPQDAPSNTSQIVYNSSVAQKVRGKLLEDSPRLLLRRPFAVPVLPLGGMAEMQRAYLTWYEFYLVNWATTLLS